MSEFMDYAKGIKSDKYMTVTMDEYQSLLKDRERIKWMDKRKRCFDFNCYEEGHREIIVLWPAIKNHFQAKSYAEAIDAAMEAEK